MIQSRASFSEVNFPKWCTVPLGHVIRTRQMPPFSITGDKTVRLSPIEQVCSALRDWQAFTLSN